MKVLRIIAGLSGIGLALLLGMGCGDGDSGGDGGSAGTGGTGNAGSAGSGGSAGTAGAATGGTGGSSGTGGTSSGGTSGAGGSGNPDDPTSPVSNPGTADQPAIDAACQHFDNDCPASCTPATDLDCSEPIEGFPLEVPSADDYTSVVYVNPNCQSENGCCGEGTEACPYESWSDIDSFAAETAYLQRRGTEDTLDGRLLPSAEHVLFGAYGEGGRPVLATTYEQDGDRGLIEVGGEYFTVRDLELSAPGLASCVKVNTFTIVYNNVVRDSGWGLRGYAHGFRVLYNEIYNTNDDGVFFQGVHHIEIGYNHVHDVNTNWVPPYTPQGEAAGDGLQLASADHWWVHDNLLDRTSSGNKFCFIGDVSTYGIFEHNETTGPLPDGDGGAGLYLSESGGGIFIIRGNSILGPTPGSSIYTHANDVEISYNLFDDSGSIYQIYGRLCPYVRRRAASGVSSIPSWPMRSNGQSPSRSQNGRYVNF